MTGNIRDWCKIGLVHHMLYPECVSDPVYHADTLEKFVRRSDIGAFDFCVPYDEVQAARAIKAVRSAVDNGADAAYALHLFPNRKLALCSPDLTEQCVARLVIRDQIAKAAAAGATSFVFVSGADMPSDRPTAQKIFADFCRWFCEKLAPHGISALLEPFDRDIDKKFLYGPIDDCVSLMETLSAEYDNIGIELDFAHLPLMCEPFDTAVRHCAPYLRRVHLGNCVLDPSHPLYGDKHPPMGLPGGMIGEQELITILRLLIEVGFLAVGQLNPLVLEMTPFPGRTAEFTVAESIKLLERAWEKV